MLCGVLEKKKLELFSMLLIGGENLIREVAASGTIRTEGIITSEEFTQKEHELKQKWRECMDNL